MIMHLYADAPFTSPYALSVFVALTEKKLPFDLGTLDLDAGANHNADYAKLSVTQRVPTLIDGDFALSESSAIVEYLDEAYPQVPVLPTDLHQRARARQVQAWLRSDFLPIRTERSTATIFYDQRATAPLSIAAQASSAKLVAGALQLLAHGGDNLFGDWSIADVDLAVMLQRLVINDDPVPAQLVRYVRLQWQREGVQQWVHKARPPL